MDLKTNSYVVDSKDRIISVGSEWDAFAIENDAPGATSTNVLGREIWDFVEGANTRTYLFGVFQACRIEQQLFSILYRCDGPDVRRLYRLTIWPSPDDSLTIGSMLVHAITSPPHPTVSAFEEYYDTTRCSVCCAFQIGDKWIDLRTPPDADNFAKSYSICPTCKDAAQVEFARMKRKSNIIPLPRAKQ
ncbi:hypothetical protein [Sulfitobacter pontiacus]|uniref:hypothetical protein n=1 Tax=Sulfitobacter pontiacus TaxID=60137 RepID=UPI0030ED83AF